MSIMSSLVDAATRGLGFRASDNWPGRYTIEDIASMYKIGELLPNFSIQPFRENITGDFIGLVDAAYRGNAVVFACEMVRMSLFSEVRFQFQQIRGGKLGDLFGTQDLAILESPEPQRTTGDLLARAIIDADLAGNWYGVRRRNRIIRLRPDWVSILLGSPNPAVDLPAWDPDTEVIGYAYWPGGPYSGQDPITFDVNEVAHFAPIPDPLASYRGMSWLTPVLREMKADTSATFHKLQFFENAATPNLIIKFDPKIAEPQVRKFIELFEQDHAGKYNAYRTAYLAGGADATVVGSSLKEMDFKSTQGAGETRIAAAAGVHPAIVGLSEGLQGASLNAGNFGAARRLTADRTLRPLWRNISGSLETLVPPPPDARLWYDARDVAFLREDVKDAADILNLESQAMRRLGDGGWEPDSVVDAVASGDWSRLRHGGYLSVQVQPIKADQTDTEEEPLAIAAQSTTPLLAAGQVEIRCNATRPDGKPCNQLIVKANHPGPLGIEGKCHRCGSLVAA